MKSYLFSKLVRPASCGGRVISLLMFRSNPLEARNALIISGINQRHFVLGQRYLYDLICGILGLHSDLHPIAVPRLTTARGFLVC